MRNSSAYIVQLIALHKCTFASRTATKITLQYLLFVCSAFSTSVEADNIPPHAQQIMSLDDTRGLWLTEQLLNLFLTACCLPVVDQCNSEYRVVEINQFPIAWCNFIWTQLLESTLVVFKLNSTHAGVWKVVERR
jgi:hypothetical protein